VAKTKIHFDHGAVRQAVSKRWHPKRLHATRWERIFQRHGFLGAKWASGPSSLAHPRLITPKVWEAAQNRQRSS